MPLLGVQTLKIFHSEISLYFAAWTVKAAAVESLNIRSAKLTFCLSRLDGQQDLTVKRWAVLATEFC